MNLIIDYPIGHRQRVEILTDMIVEEQYFLVDRKCNWKLKKTKTRKDCYFVKHLKKA